MGGPLPQTGIRVWDAPVRLFHWMLVVLIGCAWWTAEQGMLEWHRLAGFGVFTLIVFRLAWGVIGSTTARFSHFVRGPGGVAAYIMQTLLRRGAVSPVGHNPLGGWSVLAMLTLLLTQVLLGFFAVDVDGLESGPFAYLVDFDTGRWAAETHHVIFNLLLAVIVLHVAAIAFYRIVKKENLLTAMLTGRREWNGERPALKSGSPLLALALFVIVALGVWILVSLLGGG